MNQKQLKQDMQNSAYFLQQHELSTGKLGAVGFCWGGGTVNHLAVTMGGDLQAGVPFYGAAPASADVSEISAEVPDSNSIGFSKSYSSAFNISIFSCIE